MLNVIVGTYTIIYKIVWTGHDDTLKLIMYRDILFCLGLSIGGLK